MQCDKWCTQPRRGGGLHGYTLFRPFRFRSYKCEAVHICYTLLMFASCRSVVWKM